MKRSLQILICLFLGAFAAGCASVPHYDRVEGNLRQGNFPAAAKGVEDSRKTYGDSSQLLFLLDEAQTRHLEGDYVGSNQALEKANRLVDDLYTKSLSKEALSFMFNDTSLPYAGEDFERVMMHVLGMLNYAFLNQADDALVEARRADERLVSYVQQYGDDAVYREDALARYLSAVLYEGRGQYDDAYIDYKKCRTAFEQYQKAYGTAEPPMLGSDLLRMASRLGMEDDLREWKKKYPAATADSGASSAQGEALVVLYEGLAPVKVDEFITVPVGSLYFKMAFPKFVPRPGGLAGAGLSAAASTGEIPMALMEDVTAIAVKDLSARIARISAKAIARSVAKFAANSKLQDEANKSGNAATQILTFLGTNIYTLATEQADKRSWRLLPGRIYLVRLPLDPGHHDLTLTLRMNDGSEKTFHESVEIKAGKKVFLKEVSY